MGAVPKTHPPHLKVNRKKEATLRKIIDGKIWHLRILKGPAKGDCYISDFQKPLICPNIQSQLQNATASCPQNEKAYIHPSRATLSEPQVIQSMPHTLNLSPTYLAHCVEDADSDDQKPKDTSC